MDIVEKTEYILELHIKLYKETVTSALTPYSPRITNPTYTLVSLIKTYPGFVLGGIFIG